MLTSSYTQNLSKYFQQSERFYYIIIDNEENFVYVNPLFQQQFSHITANFNGRKAVDFFPETTSDKFKQAMQDCIQNPDRSYQLDLPVLPAAGFNLITRWEFTAYTNEQAVVENIQGIGFVVDEPGDNMPGISHSISKLADIGQTNGQSELFYRNMSYHLLDGIVMSDNTGKITYCGPSVEKVSGYKPADLLGHNFFEFVHPDDMPAATNAFVNEVNRKSVFNYLFLRLKHLNGQWIWCTVRAHNLLDAPGFNSVVIYFTNDSKRKEAEDKLRESEEEYRNLINNLGQGVVVQNEKSEILVFNKAALDMLGLTKDQLLGRTSFDPRWNVIHEDGSLFPGDTHPVPVAIKTKKSVRDVVMGVFRPFTNNRIWLLVNAEPVLDNNGDLINVICSFTDITEQKILSQKLIEQEVQKQRLITQATIDGQENERQQIGKELHDNINQHLTTTRLYLEVASEKATGEALEMIRLSHKTLASITHEIRQLSQSLVPPTLGDIGLVESIQDLCDSLKRAHKFGIDFYSRHFSGEQLPDNLKLMIFRITQEQVNNIVRHAEANLIQIKLESDAEFINLSISDNGKGFDPAQTKKGQGFNNISNRAALFNARVEINSSPGKGCQLSVTIPIETAAAGDELM